MNPTNLEPQGAREATKTAKKASFLRRLAIFQIVSDLACRPRAGWLLPLLVALPALVPLLREGFLVSDDGLFHVYRIAALADAWEHGVLYPRLFPQFGFGYGQAVLNYYAPLGYAPGALLAVLGMSPAAAAEWTIALGFVLASFAAYGMGKYLWGMTGGILAAIAYTYFPYHLADAYLRGALPEHMAFVFLPLIVWSTVAAFREIHPEAANLWGALAWAGLVYTHNLTVLLMAAAWIVLVLAMALAGGKAPGSGATSREQPRKWQRIRSAVAGVALAVGLSAWVWLPFLAESQYVGIGLGPSDGYVGHLAPIRQLIQVLPLYRYRVSHGAGMAEHPLGWPAALLLVGIAGWLAWRWAARRPVAAPGPQAAAPGPQAAGAAPAVYGLALAGAAAFMTSAPSLPIWRLFEPILAQLQYPWRFMTLVALGLAIAVGVVAADRGRGSGREGASRVSHGGAPGIAPGVPPGVETPGYNAMPAEAGSPPPSRPGDGAEELRPGASSARPAWEIALVVVLAAVYIISGLARTPAEPLTLAPAEAWGTARMWQEDAAAGQVGATWTGEFLPLTVTEQRWALGRPREGAIDTPAPAARPVVTVERAGYDSLALAVESGAPLTLRLHQFHLPMWRAWLNRVEVATHPSGELGLVSVDVPAGRQSVALRFGPSRSWTIAGVLAGLAVLAWAVLAFASAVPVAGGVEALAGHVPAPRPRPNRLKPRLRQSAGVGGTASRGLRVAGVALVICALVLALNGWGVGRRSWTPQPAQTAVGDVALLVGYDVETVRDALDVTLYWYALREVSTDYKVFVHALGIDGQVIGQHDGDPVGGFTPTTRWRAGEVIVDRHRVPLPAGLSGEVGIRAGMYQPELLQNLPLDPPTADGRVDLGTVTVR